MLDAELPAFRAPMTSRPLHPTMGQGVAERTYLRRIFTDIQSEKLGGYGVMLNPDDPLFQTWYVAAVNSGFAVDTSLDYPHSAAAPETRWETWHEVAHRVALGSVALLKRHRPRVWSATAVDEYERMSSALASGELLMSGRHLQQGDARQADRTLEIFSNCATSPTSFGLFTLLLNGSGVGRDYSDAMMAVDWAKDMPTVIAVLDETHPDFKWGHHMSSRDARHLYKTGQDVRWFPVPDSREGWGKGVEQIEMCAYLNGKGDNRINVLILDFTAVRAEGTPIMGMQGRPSSGPGPLMDAIGKIGKIKGSGLKPWLATLYIDHYLAEPVLVGGARRSARMSTKDWRDEDILEFIGIKRPIEFDGLTREEVEAAMAVLPSRPMSFLWSSNNSVAVDTDFWKRVRGPITSDPLTMKAKMVFQYATECAYGDGTGEPGFINVDRLTAKDDGLDQAAFVRGDYIGSEKYVVGDRTRRLLVELYSRFKSMPYHYITNPCGEISLSILGGFCVIADVVPFHGEHQDDAFRVVATAVRALMRVNLMDSFFRAEVSRTNRIGVGITGVHEAAWKFFKVGFAAMVTPDFAGATAMAEMGHDPALHTDETIRAAAFWEWMGALARHVEDTSRDYAKELGVSVPHTCMTVKPSGSVSKLFGLTEGWHLPTMRHYIRWVQYHKNSPMIQEYADKGYPVRELKTYRDHWIVGFPTEPAICGLGMGDLLVTAGEASMDDQFKWLRLGEFFLMEGGSPHDWLLHNGDLDRFLAARGNRYGNQISYTLKYKPTETSFPLFQRMILTHQPTVRCVSVMPQEKGSGSYEYLPEQSVSVVEYQATLMAIQRDEALSEDVGLEHLDCSTGACPIVFSAKKKEDL